MATVCDAGLHTEGVSCYSDYYENGRHVSLFRVARFCAFLCVCVVFLPVIIVFSETVFVTF